MNDNATAHAAADYDREITRTIPHYEAMHAEIIDLVHAVHAVPRLWLDTGCGTGALVARALGVFPETRFVLADPSAAMLEQARTRLGPRERVTFLPACDTLGLPRYESPPEVITAVLAHHYLRAEERERSLRRCHELLAEGGLFIATENVAPASARGRTIALERWRRFQLAQGRPPDAVAAHAARYGTHLFPITLEEHLALLRRVGFRVVEPFFCAVMQGGVYAIR